jgi:hypothetical protein
MNTFFENCTDLSRRYPIYKSLHERYLKRHTQSLSAAHEFTLRPWHRNCSFVFYFVPEKKKAILKKIGTLLCLRSPLRKNQSCGTILNSSGANERHGLSPTECLKVKYELVL